MKFSITDIPNESHKTHKSPVPYLGGVAIIITLTAAVILTQLLGIFPKEKFMVVAPYVITIYSIFFLGLIDDVWKIKPRSKFIIQIFVISILASVLIGEGTTAKLSSVFFFDAFVTLLWILGITNAFNLLDNLDGAVLGISIISGLTLLFLSISESQFVIALVSSILVGTASSLFIWNMRPATIYLGDAGSLLLGILFALLMLFWSSPQTNRLPNSFIPIFVMAVPIMDTCIAVFGRIARGDSPFAAGTDHISHRLQRLGFSQDSAASILWILTLAFCVLAIMIHSLDGTIQTRLIFIGMTLMALFIFFTLNLSSKSIQN